MPLSNSSPQIAVSFSADRGPLNACDAPHVLSVQLRDEHKILASQYGGPNLSLASLKDMTYTEAIISETMRLSQIVANVPRIATKPIDTPNAPTVPAGCPFSASWYVRRLHPLSAVIAQRAWLSSGCQCELSTMVPLLLHDPLPWSQVCLNDVTAWNCCYSC